jgi:hypothetical protein
MSLHYILNIVFSIFVYGIILFIFLFWVIFFILNSISEENFNRVIVFLFRRSPATNNLNDKKIEKFKKIFLLEMLQKNNIKNEK